MPWRPPPLWPAQPPSHSIWRSVRIGKEPAPPSGLFFARLNPSRREELGPLRSSPYGNPDPLARHMEGLISHRSNSALALAQVDAAVRKPLARHRQRRAQCQSNRHGMPPAMNGQERSPLPKKFRMSLAHSPLEARQPPLKPVGEPVPHEASAGRQSQGQWLIHFAPGSRRLQMLCSSHLPLLFEHIPGLIGFAQGLLALRVKSPKHRNSNGDAHRGH